MLQTRRHPQKQHGRPFCKPPGSGREDWRRGYFAIADLAAAIFAFVFVLLIGQTLRILEGDSAAMVWLAWAFVSSMLGTAAALALAARRRLERSTI